MLKEKIQADQIASMKAGEKQKVEVLRYILAQIKNKEIEKRAPLSEEEEVTVLRKQAKELNESIDSFKKGGREDLATEYQAQYDILALYLPQEMSDEDLKKEVQRIMEANKNLPNQKAVIGICMKELKTKASGDRIMKVLQSLQ